MTDLELYVLPYIWAALLVVVITSKLGYSHSTVFSPIQIKLPLQLTLVEA